MSKFSLSVMALTLAAVVSAGAQQAAPARSGPVPSIEDRTSGLRKIDGYFPLYWDERAGTMLLEVPRVDADFLLSTGLSAGLGSNDLGLDRGQGGQGRIVRFQRVGPRLMLVQGNQSFRSSSTNPLERRSVEVGVGGLGCEHRDERRDPQRERGAPHSASLPASPPVSRTAPSRTLASPASSAPASSALPASSLAPASERTIVAPAHAAIVCHDGSSIDA